MQSTLLILILSLSSISFGADSCERIQESCNILDAEYEGVLRLWNYVDTDGIIPDAVLNAENDYAVCIKWQTAQGCNKTKQ